MKTKQEQIEKMARTMCGYCSTDGKCAVSKNGREPDICANVDTQHCLYKEYAERLIDSSYGDVSEYKAEIERLKDENETLKNDLINSEGNLNHITTEFERLKAKSNEQSRKAGILGYNVTVEFHDDEVSEHSVDCKDIEKYAKQFRNRIISINEKEIKQAQLSVLGKLWARISHNKTLIQSHIADGSFTIEDIYMEIDELMAEVQNEQKD